MRVKKDILYFLGLAAMLGLAVACNIGDEPDPVPGPDKPGHSGCARTVLVYQAANNNLSTFARADLDEMLQGAADGQIPADGRLLVYSHSRDAEPYLIEVTDEGLDTLQTYSSSEYLSVDSRRMMQVFDDVRRIAPAEEYGLILWSHGTGWLQDGIDDAAKAPAKRSFGDDRGKTMNITTLAKTIADGPEWSFVYFDCCYMAGVEVAYELRHVAPVIAASTTELPDYGMPYHLTLGKFFADGEPDVEGAARTTFDYYDQWSRDATGYPDSFRRRYCTMTVVKTAALDALAQAVDNVYARSTIGYPEGSSQQQLGRGRFSSWFYDLGRYLETLCLDAGGAPRFDGAADALADVRAALADAVTFEGSMECIFGSYTPIDHHCGLSTFILTDATSPDVNNYSTLGWYTNVASKLIK